MRKIKAKDITIHAHYWINGQLRYVSRVDLIHGARVRVEHGGGASLLAADLEVTAL